jgi:hypothetical protein
MRLFVLVAMLLSALPSWAMTQCPAGTRSGFMWRCVSIPAEETMATIAHYSSVESACSAAYPAQSAEYKSKWKYRLSTRDLWPGEKVLQSTEYASFLAAAVQRIQAFEPTALERECAYFLSH